VDGLLVLDKPSGMTSHDVVALVRRATGEKSIGHLGTLDPMATGVLPLLLGRYTRLAQFFGSAQKSYIGHIRFGYATDTYDAEGEPTSPVAALQCGLDQLRQLAGEFLGESEQMPPVYSAKKINGVPAHKLARAGKPVVVRPANVHIDNFDLLALEGAEASFAMTISAGGYVRSVAHELGQKAGCGAHLASLRRTRAGDFSLDGALTIEELKALGPAGQLAARMVHPRVFLPRMPSVTVDDRTAGRMRNGMTVNLPEYSAAKLVKVFTGPSDLMGIATRVAGTLMQPTVVLA
jgi:tRNA pseudouridine55 synthase